MIAPIAMMIAELPLNPLPPPAFVLLVIVGTAVVVGVGIETLGCGKPGESGLLPGCALSDGGDVVALAVCVAAVDDCAPAAAGRASAAPRSAARTTRIAVKSVALGAYASGCSIAGVSGASA